MLHAQGEEGEIDILFPAKRFFATEPLSRNFFLVCRLIGEHSRLCDVNITLSGFGFCFALGVINRHGHLSFMCVLRFT